MDILTGMLFLPLLMGGIRREGKIDKRLLQKTRLMGSGNLSAIVFSHEDEEPICREHLKKMGAKIKYELPLIHAYAVELPASHIEEMAKSKSVKYISDDVKINTLLDVATQEIGARIVNETGYKGRNIGIAILDTGVYPHPDLVRPRNRIVAFKDFINNREGAYDDNGHGTFVAGAAAGNGYSSGGKYAGVAPQANIIGVKVMDRNGEGNSSDIVAGMQWVVDNQREYNIRVMSLSLGAEASKSLATDVLAVAVAEVWKRGIVVVAAAGNSGPGLGTITTPGVSSDIITVGAVDDKRTIDISDDTVAEFSSRGPVRKRIVKPDVVAPGVNLVSLNADKNYTAGGRVSALTEEYTTMSGTSVSTPLVSGICTLLLEKNPNYTPNQIKKLLMEHTHVVDKNKYAQGMGLVDVKSIMGI